MFSESFTWNIPASLRSVNSPDRLEQFGSRAKSKFIPILGELVAVNERNASRVISADFLKCLKLLRLPQRKSTADVSQLFSPR